MIFKYFIGSQLPGEYVEQKLTIETKFECYLQQPEIRFKLKMLGINSHLTDSIKKGFLNGDQFWFTDFMNAVEEGVTANVTIFSRIVKRTDTLRHNVTDWQIKQCHNNRDGRATHLVTQVVYGAELILSIRKSVDCQRETKESVEQNIYLAAKTYFDQAINSNWVQPPVELENVTCNIISSQGVIRDRDYSFQIASDFIRFHHVDNNSNMWRPIEMVLFRVNTVEALFLSEKMVDIQEEKKRHYHMWEWIINECQTFVNHPHLRRLSPLKKIVYQFQDLLRPISIKMTNINKTCGTHPPQKVLQNMEIISELLAAMKDWLIHRRAEIEALCWLLSDVELAVVHWEEIEERIQSGKENVAKIFVLKFGYKSDPLMEKMIKFVDYQESPCWLPVFPIMASNIIRQGEVRDKLIVFKNEAELNSASGSNRETHCHIGLISVRNPCDDGDVFIMKYFYDQEAQKDTIKILQEEQRRKSSSMKPAEDKKSVKTSIETFRKDNVPSAQNIKKYNTANEEQVWNSSGLVNDSADRRFTDTSPRTESFNQKGKTTTNQMDLNNIISREVCLLKGRIAETFINNYSRPLKLEGQLNVHLLTAEVKSADFLWFDIGRPDGSPPNFGFKNHKIIILMGATGSGKSTLINGMVNYILGVRWEDPFRFKCVHEEAAKSRNQALSQTSSVTAYNIRHHEGMTIPYSITIIDTPGYGDTRGVARDKEITKTIHRFLTQEETRIDQIHAACFVAASGDSRLTVTQRYILDSVLSIFGKDFKDNIRLLVTFADNSDPPVIEACRAAHFPVTSESDGITYSKFNSSVLYASNIQKEEDCFDQLFWNMGQDNFAKFFKMLEGMDGKDLTSTRQVIHFRQEQERSLKDIELELEVSLVQIEKIEMLRRRILLLSESSQRKSNYSNEQLLEKYSDDLNTTKIRVLNLLEQVGANARSLDSTSLRSNALTPSDYIRLMRSRVAEEQAPGYLTRLETLNELEESLKQTDRFLTRVTPLMRSMPGPSTKRGTTLLGAHSRSDRYKSSKSGIASNPIAISNPSEPTRQREIVKQQQDYSVRANHNSSSPKRKETEPTPSSSSRSKNWPDDKIEQTETEGSNGKLIEEHKRRDSLVNRSKRRFKKLFGSNNEPKA